MLKSPLRYPGGKAKLLKFLTALIAKNGLWNKVYCEPYAGGAGLALELLGNGFVDSIVINDIDFGINCFWSSVLYRSEELSERIMCTPLNIEVWHHQLDIYRNQKNFSKLEVGFATFYLNRTNRSGIISGAGPIGGYQQKGTWKLDARFNRNRLTKLVSDISMHKDQITVSRLDAAEFIPRHLNKDSFMYLDPPYVVKGGRLYSNHYDRNDHTNIRDILLRAKSENWLLSYDADPFVLDLYKDFQSLRYKLGYSAAKVQLGEELLVFSDSVRVTSEGLRGPSEISLKVGSI